MKGYVYQFINEQDEVIYIGRTRDIVVRMYTHFNQGQGIDSNIPKEVKEKVKKVIYTETETYSNAMLLEAYLIAKEKPVYNKEYVFDDDLTYTVITGDIEWKEFKNHYGDKPNQSLAIYKGDDWLYEVPYIEEVYEPLRKKLNINADLRHIRYCSPVCDGDYKIIRIRGNRRRTGQCQKFALYKYIGGEYVKHCNEDEIGQITE